MKKKKKIEKTELDKFESHFQIPFLTTFLRLIYWNIKDIFTHIRKKRRGLIIPHLYGIFGYYGLPGRGKTMAMSYKLLQLRKRYGNSIYICTNYNFAYQDFAFTDWKQLLQHYDKPLVVGWDEVQNLFNSRDFKNFPVELLTLLTQNRKGHGIQIHYSAQRWARVDKVFRELTTVCYDCRTFMKRLTTTRGFGWEEYEMLLAQTNIETKKKIHFSRNSFIQTDFIRNCYDSFKMLESAKSKMYIDKDEANAKAVLNAQILK